VNFLLTKYLLCFGGHAFQQTVGTPMGTNCALLADLFLYSYEADFIQGLLKKNEKKLARSFNFTFRYIDDVLLLNNSRLGIFVDRIYVSTVRYILHIIYNGKIAIISFVVKFRS
jgi:hypothetical protein